MSFSTNTFEEKMDKSLENLKEFQGLRTGRAGSLLEPISVEAYGSKVPLSQVSNISVPESRLITVQVWDQSLYCRKCNKKFRLRIKSNDRRKSH